MLNYLKHCPKNIVNNRIDFATICIILDYMLSERYQSDLMNCSVNVSQLIIGECFWGLFEEDPWETNKENMLLEVAEVTQGCRSALMKMSWDSGKEGWSCKQDYGWKAKRGDRFVNESGFMIHSQGQTVFQCQCVCCVDDYIDSGYDRYRPRRCCR